MTLILKGKVALITGGSAGLGAAVARQLAAEGVNLAINYNNSDERAAQVAESLASEFGIKTVIIKGHI